MVTVTGRGSSLMAGTVAESRHSLECPGKYGQLQVLSQVLQVVPQTVYLFLIGN
jgi:hypothetical protein